MDTVNLSKVKLSKVKLSEVKLGKVGRSLRAGLALMLVLSAISCGGGDGGVTGTPSPPTPPPAAATNMVSVVVDAGPSGAAGSVNTLFTTVTICVPGSTECQTIDHIQVDTASDGLRILGPVLTLALPTTKASDGNSLAECTQFVDGYSWGPVALADIQVAGETAGSVPIQVIGAANFAPVPAACSSTGPVAEDTVAAFGANGILGIGVFEQDCGTFCVSNANSTFYFSCTATACAGTAVPFLSQEVLNPVPLFATDNNGTLIELPAVAGAGEATLTGSLIFGIDTQSNNASGKQSVLTVDPSNGDFTIVFNGVPLTQSFIDSGSNGIYFNDTSLAACTQMGFTNFYCPSATQTLTATLTGGNNVSATASFSVGNAYTVAAANPSFSVLPTLAGSFMDPNNPQSSTETFDFGLPFYYGRRVATAIETRATAVGTGPYIAF